VDGGEGDLLCLPDYLPHPSRDFVGEDLSHRERLSTESPLPLGEGRPLERKRKWTEVREICYAFRITSLTPPTTSSARTSPKGRGNLNRLSPLGEDRTWSEAEVDGGEGDLLCLPDYLPHPSHDFVGEDLSQRERRPELPLPLGRGPSPGAKRKWTEVREIGRPPGDKLPVNA